LVVGDTTVAVEVGGHEFEIAINEDYYELHVGVLSDSKQNVVYRGPFKEGKDLNEEIRKFAETRPNLPLMWRKSKTVLKIKSRCNSDVWDRTQEQSEEVKKSIQHRAALNGIRHYFAELCRTHIPVVNALVQRYRLATYDYFPYEASPRDIPFWVIEHNGKSARSSLVPYREWDVKPKGFATPFDELVKKIVAGEQFDPPTIAYKFIEEADLQHSSIIPAPGEFELLDSLSLMERGDYSGAVRGITTALEVILESVVGKEVELAEGKRTAVRKELPTEVLAATSLRESFLRRSHRMALSCRCFHTEGLREKASRRRSHLGLIVRIRRLLINSQATPEQAFRF
jgi:hypothetical protein